MQPYSEASPRIRGGERNTPDTMRSKPKNKWEQAASLMFKKESSSKKTASAHDSRNSQNYQRHVQRMLLGRVKKRSEKKFDQLRHEMFIARQPDNVVKAASQSLAGFRIASALDNLLKKRMRLGFFRWHRLLRESQIEEQFGHKISRKDQQIEWLKDALTRKHEALMRIANRMRIPLTAWCYATVVL